MSKDIEKIWRGIEDRAFADQKKIEDEALALFKQDPAKAKQFLTDYCLKTANQAVDRLPEAPPGSVDQIQLSVLSRRFRSSG